MSTSQPTLLGLPTELRLEILEYILSPDNAVNIRPRRASRLKPTRIQSPYFIIQINSKIRSEALKIFYNNITFRIRDGMSRDDMREWLFLQQEWVPRKIIFYAKGRCTMFGLQPDFNYLLMLNGFYSCDYCHRELHFDCNKNDDGGEVTIVDLCSNRAFGCVELTSEALKEVKGNVWSLTEKEVLMAFFVALERDNSSSAA